MTGVPLAAVLEDLREQIGSVAAAGFGERWRFDMGPIEVTLSVEVSRETTPGAKVKFWVVEAGTDVALSKASTQQVKLTLTPVDTTTAPPPPPGAARITDDSVPGER